MQSLMTIFLLLVTDLQRKKGLKKKESGIVLFPSVSGTECFPGNLLWVFEQRVARAFSHVNI